MHHWLIGNLIDQKKINGKGELIYIYINNHLNERLEEKDCGVISARDKNKP